MRTPPGRLGCRGAEAAGRRAEHSRAVRRLLVVSAVVGLPSARGHESQRGLIRLSPRRRGCVHLETATRCTGKPGASCGDRGSSANLQRVPRAEPAGGGRPGSALEVGPDTEHLPGSVTATLHSVDEGKGRGRLRASRNRLRLGPKRAQYRLDQCSFRVLLTEAGVVASIVIEPCRAVLQRGK